jgi:hypothetical protein
MLLNKLVGFLSPFYKSGSEIVDLKSIEKENIINGLNIWKSKNPAKDVDKVATQIMNAFENNLNYLDLKGLDIDNLPEIIPCFIKTINIVGTNIDKEKIKY